MEIVRLWTNRRPVIILGNQKSGTTAIAALLGELTGRQPTLDIPKEVSNPTLHLVHCSAVSFDRIVRQNRREFARRIIKEPNLTFCLDHLVRCFPSARFVFIVRDPRDNVRSILDRLKLPGDLPDITPEQWRTIPLAWQYVIDNRWQHIERGTYIEDLARRWNAAVHVYLRHRQSLRLVRYEDFCADKVGVISRLAEQTGLAARRDIAEIVDRQYQPRGNREARWDEFFGPANLARINEICGPLMQIVKYQVSTMPPGHGPPSPVAATSPVRGDLS
jgi:hypothetical protein